MFVIGGLQLCYEIKYCFVYIFGKYTVLNLHQATESSRQVSEKNFHDGCYRSSFVFAIEVRHLLQQQQIRFIIQKQISHNIDECEYPLGRIESLRTCTKCFSFALRPFTFYSLVHDFAQTFKSRRVPCDYWYPSIFSPKF